MITAGNVLKDLRTQKNMSMRSVVTASGGVLDKTTISRIERSERGISLKAAYCFSQVYDIDLTDLAELLLDVKARAASAPFTTSAAERLLLTRFRMLTAKQQGAVAEQVRGLSCVAGFKSHEAARSTLMREISRVKSLGGR